MFPAIRRTVASPSQTIIKLNMLVKIYTRNYDSQYGLVNGADGIIKSYTKTSEVGVIWIKFYDPKIGHHQGKIGLFI